MRVSSFIMYALLPWGSYGIKKTVSNRLWRSVAALIVYVATYYAIVSINGVTYAFTGLGPWRLGLRNVVSNPVLRVLFEPMYRIDYMLRPSFWTVPDAEFDVEFMMPLFAPHGIWHSETAKLHLSPKGLFYFEDHSALLRLEYKGTVELEEGSWVLTSILARIGGIDGYRVEEEINLPLKFLYGQDSDYRLELEGKAFQQISDTAEIPEDWEVLEQASRGVERPEVEPQEAVF